MENNESRAYVVRLTDAARHSLTDYDFTFLPSDTFTKAQPLDLDALAVVLDAANCHRETMDERANDPRTLDDVEARQEADALGDAIAKLETAINPANNGKA